MEQQIIALALDDGDGDLRIAVQAEVSGSQLVDSDSISAKFSEVAGAVESVSRQVLDAVKAATPDKATLELAFGLTIENGRLLAMLGKVGGEASIKVTLEWSKA